MAYRKQIPPNITNPSGNIIEISQFRHPRDVSNYIYCVNNLLLNNGYQDISINCSKATTFFPNAAVPICSYIDYLRDIGFVVNCTSPSRPMLNTFIAPLEATDINLQKKAESLSKIWKFDSNQIFNLVTALVYSISEHIVCQSGVLDSIEWSLNEVMDNVLQHSKANHGYVMAQVHRDSGRVTICVSDVGIGIHNSLKHSKYHPRTASDSLTLSIKSGVTRSGEVGRGNGLFGLSEIVKRSPNGLLRLTSGRVSLFLSKTETKIFDKLPTLLREYSNVGTVVDFQFKTDNSINISEALGGHSPLFGEMRNDQFIDNSGTIIINVCEHAHGYGTRISGELLRNKVLNLYNEVKQKVEIDFNTVSVVSSSFADEFIGKIVSAFGFTTFHQIFTLKNMSASTKGLIDIAVAKRLQESYKQ